MKTTQNQFAGDATLDRLNNLTRWQGYPTHRPESVAQHSYWVTYWTAALMAELTQSILDKPAKNHLQAVTMSCKAMELAIFHDVDESITGDVTHPVKYNRHNGPVIRAALKDYINHELPNLWNAKRSYGHLAQTSIQPITNLDHALSTVVKVADYLSMFNFCLNEADLGNSLLCSELAAISGMVVQAMTVSEKVLCIDMDCYPHWNFEIFKTITLQMQEQCKLRLK